LLYSFSVLFSMFVTLSRSLLFFSKVHALTVRARGLQKCNRVLYHYHHQLLTFPWKVTFLLSYFSLSRICIYIYYIIILYMCFSRESISDRQIHFIFLFLDKLKEIFY
jgi:hypothetical protein